MTWIHRKTQRWSITKITEEYRGGDAGIVDVTSMMEELIERGVWTVVMCLANIEKNPVLNYWNGQAVHLQSSLSIVQVKNC